MAIAMPTKILAARPPTPVSNFVAWRLSPLLLALFLVACERPPVAPRHPEITLDVRVIGDTDPRSIKTCAEGVAAPLRYHGFVIAPGAPRVEVEAALYR